MMKKAVLVLIALGYSIISIAQSKEIVPIILDGKPAYMNTATGKVVTKKEALSRKYKKIKLNNFPSTLKKSSAVQVSSENGEHMVSSGETLYSVARSYGLSVSTLKAINELTSNVLHVGQVLQVKETTNFKESSTKGNVHTVVSGETLYSISRKYGVSVSKLKALNALTNNTISIGQELVVEQ